jgi:hypothetical protein
MWVRKRKCGLTSSAVELCGCLKRSWWVLENAGAEEREGGDRIATIAIQIRSWHARARKQFSERKPGRKFR